MRATTVPTLRAPLTASRPPQPYTRAVASDAVSIKAAKKMRLYMAEVTPMSRTRPALASNVPVSARGWPNNFTSKAPATLKRSLMVVFISALRA